MRLTDANLESKKLPTGAFTFSATRLKDLGAAKYTLVGIAVDRSGSTKPFRGEMEKAIQTIVQACKHSPETDNLLLRLCTFDHEFDEIHGYKLLDKCNLDDYIGCLSADGNLGGMTALFDASLNIIEAGSTYAADLTKNDFEVNAIDFIITDGDNNRGAQTPKQVKEALKARISGEMMESSISILIAVNITEDRIKLKLEEFNKEVEFTQFIDMGEATPERLAKLAKFVSKSISSQSRALGTGGPSKPLQI